MSTLDILVMIRVFVTRVVQFFLICLPMMLIGIVVLAIVLPFVPKEAEVLPRFVRWFDNWGGVTRGYPGGDGLQGDAGYRAIRVADGHTSLFWERYYWLALRNPTNYFNYKVLGVVLQEGFKFEPQALVILNTTGFFSSLKLTNDSKHYYQYYIQVPYTLLGFKKLLTLRFGHKLTSYPENKVGLGYEYVLNFYPAGKP